MNGSMKRVAGIAALCTLFLIGCNGRVRAETVIDVTPGNADFLTYKIVDTSQTECFDDARVMGTIPAPGDEYYGQDGNYAGFQQSYTLSEDGKTVFDNVTGLTWQRSPNLTLTAPSSSDKMSLKEAMAYPDRLNEMNYGGYDDWRLPTIKELYSLIQFSGEDVSILMGRSDDLDGLTPFINTDYFRFSYGDTGEGERIIDAQYVSSTSYVANLPGMKLQFGVNMADGRIKGYGTYMLEQHRDKTFFVLCVRGNIQYGINDFQDNGDGTVTDRATGLMWARDDSGTGMTWEEALDWVQEMNSRNYLGHSDWRLPNSKELQSIVDYENAPSYNGKPAIDTDFFDCTPIVNEAGEADYAYYWTGTTHKSAGGVPQDTADYICFGRALGYMEALGGWTDVHGAGSQRSDPKVAPTPLGTEVTVNGIAGYYHGPQGDAIRSSNFVRLVRTAD